MSLVEKGRQKTAQAELPLGPRGEAPKTRRSGEVSTATNGDGRSGSDHLMEQVVERGNVEAALKRVRKNKGSPGIDGMTVEELANKPLAAMKERVRQITGRSRGHTLKQVVQELRQYLNGWKEYFRLADTPRVFADLDAWIRRRLRMVQLKQWKRPATVYRQLRARAVPDLDAKGAAAHARRWWRTSNHRALNTFAFPPRYYDEIGLPRLARQPQPSEPPDTDPYVRWCGRGTAGETRRPYPD